MILSKCIISTSIGNRILQTSEGYLPQEGPGRDLPQWLHAIIVLKQVHSKAPDVPVLEVSWQELAYASVAPEQSAVAVAARP
jgi:hypothetical protein